MTTFQPAGSFIKRTGDKTPPDPARTWLAIVTIAAVAFIVIVVWNVWAFDTAAHGGVIGTPLPETPAVFNRSSLDTIRTVFAARAEEEAKYVTGTYRYTDPSQ